MSFEQAWRLSPRSNALFCRARRETSLDEMEQRLYASFQNSMWQRFDKLGGRHYEEALPKRRKRGEESFESWSQRLEESMSAWDKRAKAKGGPGADPGIATPPGHPDGAANV